jgi:hypothetical protein
MFSTEDTLRAPSIRLRLPAKRVRIAMFIICVVVIGYFSWQIVKGSWGIAVFWSWILVNALAWGWELWYLFRRSPVLLSISELATRNRYRRRVTIFWFVVSVNAALMLSVSHTDVGRADIVILMLILYNLLTLAWLEYDALRWFRWPKIEKWFWATTIFWSSIAVIFGFVVFYSLRTPNAQDLDLGIAVMTAATSIIVFIMQRLEERIMFKRVLYVNSVINF